MAAKKVAPAKDSKVVSEPSPVDVKASVPLEIKMSPETIGAIGDTVKSEVSTPESITQSDEPTPSPVADVEVPPSVTATEPLPVIIVDQGAPPPRPDVIKGEGDTLAPTTTEQDDLVTEAQRNINLIWETTQSKIALIVVGGGIVVNGFLVIAVALWDIDISVVQLSVVTICLQFINLTVGVVIGFYFSRMNHANRGGVGKQPQEAAYTGR